jgi:hypothetical protein
VEQVVYNGGPLREKETFTFVADQAPGIYQSETVVTTSVEAAEVTAITRVAGKFTGSRTGSSGESLLIDWQSNQ